MWIFKKASVKVESGDTVYYIACSEQSKILLVFDGLRRLGRSFERLTQLAICFTDHLIYLVAHVKNGRALGPRSTVLKVLFIDWFNCRSNAVVAALLNKSRLVYFCWQSFSQVRDDRTRDKLGELFVVGEWRDLFDQRTRHVCVVSIGH